VHKSEKQTFVSELSGAFAKASAVFVTQQSGLTVSDVTELRRKIREAGASFKVAKNTLARIAVEQTHYGFLKDYFVGPTGVSFASDPVAAAKILVQFSETNDKLKIIGGAIGDMHLDAASVIQLSKLPSLNEIRGTLVSLLMTPATRIARVAVEPAAQLARVIAAYGRS